MFFRSGDLAAQLGIFRTKLDQTRVSISDETTSFASQVYIAIPLLSQLKITFAEIQFDRRTLTRNYFPTSISPTWLWRVRSPVRSPSPLSEITYMPCPSRAYGATVSSPVVHTVKRMTCCGPQFV